jgi:hypothetical protein
MIGTVPAVAPVISFDNSLDFNETNNASQTNALFTTLPLNDRRERRGCDGAAGNLFPASGADSYPQTERNSRRRDIEAVLSTSGAGANFASATGLRAKWDVLSEAQLIDTNWFNAARYPLSFYLGNENYVKTVVSNGEAKAAITKYLAGGGAIVILATGPSLFITGTARRINLARRTLCCHHWAYRSRDSSSAPWHFHAAIHQSNHLAISFRSICFSSGKRASSCNNRFGHKHGQPIRAIHQGH